MRQERQRSSAGRRGVVVGLVCALVGTALLVANPATGEHTTPGVEKKRFTLTILHNNDAESQLIDAGSDLEDFGGVARFQTLVDQLRAAGRAGDYLHHRADTTFGTIMLSSGDNFLAGPEFNASLENGVPYYDATAMDLIGYDAVAIGNHDFDFGPEVLANFIDSFNSSVPFLSANLDVSAEPELATLRDEGRIAESTVVRERGERIGVIGATTPQLASISSPRNVQVDPDVAAEVQEEVAELEDRGVNKIILISHLQSIQEDLALAPQLSGVDVMIAGGGDELLANEDDLLIPGDVAFGPYPMEATDADGSQVPVITTSGAYRYAGRLVVDFNRRGELIKIRRRVSGPLRVSAVAPDAVEPNAKMLRRVVDPVQESIADLEANVIGTSEVALNGLRNDVRTIETNEGNLISDSLLWQASQVADNFGAPQPDVALQNGGGIRNDSIIGPGEITELDTFDMLPFPNFVSIVPQIPPRQFKQILENAVSNVEEIDGRFTQVAGFSFTWDASQQAQQVDDAGTVLQRGRRVREVTLDDGTRIVSDGRVVAGAPALDIATIDFSARGGDQYPFRGAPFITLGVTYQQALVNYIQDALNGTITDEQYPEGGEGRITRLN